MSEGRDKGLCLPFTERSIGFQSLPTPASTSQRCHVGFYGCLVNEHQPLRQTLHGWLTPTAPFGPGLSYISAFLFRGQQRFFYS